MCMTIFSLPLIIINVITLIFGLVASGFGFYLRYNTAGLLRRLDMAIEKLPYKEYTEELIKEVRPALGPMLLGIGLFGLAIAAISLIGLIAVCCRVKFFLLVYQLLLGALLLGQVIALIALRTQKQLIVDMLKKKFASFLPYYEGANGTNKESKVWNVIMVQANCCGIDSGADFNKATMPICCHKPINEACMKKQTAKNSYYYNGCYKLFSEKFHSAIKVINTWFSLVLCIQAGVLILTIVLGCCPM